MHGTVSKAFKNDVDNQTLYAGTQAAFKSDVDIQSGDSDTLVPKSKSDIYGYYDSTSSDDCSDSESSDGNSDESDIFHGFLFALRDFQELENKAKKAASDAKALKALKAAILASEQEADAATDHLVVAHRFYHEKLRFKSKKSRAKAQTKAQIKAQTKAQTKASEQKHIHHQTRSTNNKRMKGKLDPQMNPLYREDDFCVDEFAFLDQKDPDVSPDEPDLAEEEFLALKKLEDWFWDKQLFPSRYSRSDSQDTDPDEYRDIQLEEYLKDIRFEECIQDTLLNEDHKNHQFALLGGW